MSAKKLISVAMATYNCGAIMKESLDSIVHQSYINKELIIVDGKSDDKTLSIIKEYAEQYPFIKWISEPDKGIYDAMNKALDIATGDYLIFMGSDDHFVSYDTLERVSKHMVNHDYVYYGDIWRPLSNDIYCGRFYSFKLAVKNISHQAIFYPKTIYKNKKYNQKYRIMGDYAYNIELWNNYCYKYMREPVSFISQYGISSNEKDDIFENDRCSLMCQNLGVWAYLYASLYHFLRNIIKGEL